MLYKAEHIFTRLLIPFAAGIITAYFSGIHFSKWLILILFILFLGSEYIIRGKAMWLFHFKWTAGLVFVTCIFFCGAIFTYHFIDVNNKKHFSRQIISGDYALLKLDAPLEDKGKNFRVVTKVLALGSNEKLNTVKGNAVLYLAKDSSSSKLLYGDCIVVRSKFQETKPPVNPGQFDLKKYLAFKNIYYTISPKAGEWKVTGINRGNFFFRKTYQLRDVCLSVINRSIKPEKERSVLSALILGYRDHLDYDVVKSFTSAGVIHILAVSGLHVGLIYFLLNSIFQFLDRMNKWKWIRMPAVLFIIWGVAVVTGSSGSVIRAAMMITLLVIGKNMKWHIQTINIVAASAFMILLMYGPLVLFDAGFQLSVFAILGITLLSKPIIALIEIENKLLAYAWQITAVSLAATIGTIPLSLYYFHQFPLYFIIANIIAIPLSTLTIYSGLLMLLLSPIPFINTGVSEAVTFLLKILHGYIHHIEILPHSVVKLSYFPFASMLLIILGIVTLCMYLESKRKLNLYIAALSFAAILIMSSLHSSQMSAQKSFTVFSFPGKTVIQARANARAVLMGDSSALESDWNQRYFQQLWQSACVKETNVLNKKSISKNASFVFSNKIFLKNQFMQVDNKRIAVINSLPVTVPKEKLQADYLVLAENAKIHIEDLMKYFSFKQLIFASSNYKKKTAGWMQEARSLNISFHSVPDEGAFQINW